MADTIHDRRDLRRSLLPPATAILVLVVAGTILFSRTRDYGLVGWDTYPLILSSRIESWTDLIGTFTEELMDGQYAGHFFRPVLNLTLAADYSLWGLNPAGYQLTNLVLFVLASAMVYLLARRLSGEGSVLGPLAALLVFMLHPTHAEVIPVASRRPETLACLFMTAALWRQLSPRVLARGRPALWPTVLAILAFLSKETSFILPILTFGAVYSISSHMGAARRLRRAGEAAAPQAAALGLVLLWRLAVLGGIGGHQQINIRETIGDLPAALRRMSDLLLFPQAEMHSVGWGMPVVIGFGVALLLSAVVGGRPRSRQAWRLVLPVGWMLLAGIAYAITGQLLPWYMLLPVAGLSLLAGLGCEWLVGLLRGGKLRKRLLAGLSLTLMLVLLIWQASYSPIIHPYDEWERATAAADNFLTDLLEKIDNAPDGSVIYSDPVPFWLKPGDRGPQIRGAAVLSDYTIEAWSRLVRPRRLVRVRLASAATREEAAPDELLILLTRRLPGY